MKSVRIVLYMVIMMFMFALVACDADTQTGPVDDGATQPVDTTTPPVDTTTPPEDTTPPDDDVVVEPNPCEPGLHFVSYLTPPACVKAPCCYIAGKWYGTAIHDSNGQSEVMVKFYQEEGKPDIGADGSSPLFSSVYSGTLEGNIIELDGSEPEYGTYRYISAEIKNSTITGKLTWNDGDDSYTVTFELKR